MGVETHEKCHSISVKVHRSGGRMSAYPAIRPWTQKQAPTRPGADDHRSRPSLIAGQRVDYWAQGEKQ